MSGRFAPDKFTLGPNPQGLILDTEVASRIVEAIYDHNKAGQNGNNRSVSGFNIDPAGLSPVHAPGCLGDEYSPMYQTSFAASSDEPARNNGLFGRAVQEAFDLGERRNRAGMTETALMIGTIVIGGGTAEAELITKTEAYTATQFTGYLLIGAFLLGAPAVNNAYRRTITNPRFHHLHERHLRAAEQVAASLNLPPVISR